MLTPVFAWAVLGGNLTTALLIFMAAGLSDGLDGLLARRWQQESQLGQILDPIGDKLLIVVAYVVLALPGRGFEPLPWWLTTLTILRDLGIVIGAMIIRYLTGFSNFKPSQPGKWNTVVLLLLLVLFLSAHNLPELRPILPGAYAVAAVMIGFSGLHYIYFAHQELRIYYQDKANEH
jgi:cardiolipin synthase (CMP-forming)